MEIDDDRVEVIVTRILNGKLENYRHSKLCDERFKEVEEVKNDVKKLIENIDSKFNKLYLLLVATLTGVVINLSRGFLEAFK